MRNRGGMPAEAAGRRSMASSEGILQEFRESPFGGTASFSIRESERQERNQPEQHS